MEKNSLGIRINKSGETIARKKNFPLEQCDNKWAIQVLRKHSLCRSLKNFPCLINPKDLAGLLLKSFFDKPQEINWDLKYSIESL